MTDPRTKPEEWYSVPLTEIREVAEFPTRFNRLQLVNLLSRKYPDYQWDKLYLLKGKYAQQMRLEIAVRNLFPVWIILIIFIFLKN